jgi:RNA polymerase sigma-70 factor (ECF subfamily)
MGTRLDDISDYDLIRLCLNEDAQYFQELVTRYKNLVYSVILRMVNDREDANDLAQEVFIKVYKNLNKYYPEYKVSTWIIRITTNHVIDYRRKKRPESVPFEDAELQLASAKSPEDNYVAKEQREMLASFLASLPDMYKIPIMLYHNEGLSYQEISEIIKEPLSKVKNRIFRGRKMLKEMILNSLNSRAGECYGLR